jgi:hypothetical protein
MTFAEVSKETLKIEAFLKTFNPGQTITYKEIEKETSVRMDNRGKAFMRTALKRLNLEYSCIRGEGIELCSPFNATSMIACKVIRVDKAVRRAEKTTKRVTSQFYKDLSEQDKQHVNVVASIFGALRGYATNARLLFKRPPPQISN